MAELMTLYFCRGRWWRRSWFSLKGKVGFQGQVRASFLRQPTLQRHRPPPCNMLHHEPILAWNLPKHHDAMIRITGWLSPAAAA